MLVENIWIDLKKLSALGENSHTINFSTCSIYPHQKKSYDVVRIIDLLMTLMTSVREVHYIRTVTPILGHGSVKVSSFTDKCVKHVDFKELRKYVMSEYDINYISWLNNKIHESLQRKFERITFDTVV